MGEAGDLVMLCENVTSLLGNGRDLKVFLGKILTSEYFSSST